jgi:hypothetical protein
MAVSLPVIVLLYELVKYYQHADRKPLLRWIRSDASPALVGGLITAIYVHGRLSVIDSYNKTYGPHGGFEGYTPHYSWAGFVTSNARFMSDLSYLSPHHFISGGTILGLWALTFLYAFWRRDRMLELMAFWVVITPLPLAFISVRGPTCLSLLLFGWATILSRLVSDCNYPVRFGIEIEK